MVQRGRVDVGVVGVDAGAGEMVDDGVVEAVGDVAEAVVAVVGGCRILVGNDGMARKS